MEFFAIAAERVAGVNLHNLECFLVVAEELNITRAAEILFISQQAVSSNIKRLEEEYNIQLFERKPVMRLTLAGERMVAYAKNLLTADINLRSTFSDISENHRGVLRIGMSRLRTSAYFSQVWDQFHTQYPSISVEITSSNSEESHKLLQNGKIDFYLGLDVPHLPNTKCVMLAVEKTCCCMTLSLLKKYRQENAQTLFQAFQRGVDLLQVLDIPFISLSPSNRLRRNLDQFFCTQIKRPYFLFSCDQQAEIYKMAKKGDGIGLLSPVFLDYQKEDLSLLKDEFRIFPIANSIPIHRLYLVHRTDYPLAGYTQNMIQLICDLFQTRGSASPAESRYGMGSHDFFEYLPMP